MDCCLARNSNLFNFNNLTIIGSTISNNGAHYLASNNGGGIASQGGNLNVINSTISGNTVDSTGQNNAGGILIFSGSSTITRSCGDYAESIAGGLI